MTKEVAILAVPLAFHNSAICIAVAEQTRWGILTLTLYSATQPEKHKRKRSQRRPLSREALSWPAGRRTPSTQACLRSFSR